MFKINICDPDLSSGSVPLTWCFSEDTVKSILENYKDPHIIICVAPKDELGADETPSLAPLKELRFSAPIKDMMTYIHFNSFGENNIVAIITDKDQVYNYMARYNNRYCSTLLKGNELYLDLLKYKFSDDGSDFVVYSETLKVDVPKEAFAKPPSSAEMEWVTLLLSDKMLDECAFRKRRLFAYSFQPFFIFFLFLFRIFTYYLPALLFLSRSLSFKYFNVISISHGDAFSDLMLSGSYCVNEEPDEPYSFKETVQKFWKMIFMPFSIMLLIFGVLVPNFGIALLFIIVCVTLFVTVLVFRESLKDFLTKRKNVSFDQDDIEAIVCNGKTYKSVYDLPSKKKTLKLMFSALKSKVCKPYSR